MARSVQVGAVEAESTERRELPGAGSHPAPAGSALFDLRAILAAKREALHIDLPVPRWGGPGEPAIVVRYGPVDPTRASESAERRQRSKAKDWAVLANADVLVSACVGVFAEVDGQRYSLRVDDPEGEWTRFDKDLAAALGLDAEHAKAVDVVRTLYLTDGDLIAAANALAIWSATALPEAEAEALGE